MIAPPNRFAIVATIVVVPFGERVMKVKYTEYIEIATHNNPPIIKLIKNNMNAVKFAGIDKEYFVGNKIDIIIIGKKRSNVEANFSPKYSVYH